MKLTIRDASGRWPFPQASDRSAWHRVRAQDVDELREIVLPISQGRTFLIVGEPADHVLDESGAEVAVHAICLLATDGRWYLREMPIDNNVLVRARRELESLLLPRPEEPRQHSDLAPSAEEAAR